MPATLAAAARRLSTVPDAERAGGGKGLTSTPAFGLGLGSCDVGGSWLELYYPQPVRKAPPEVWGALRDLFGYRGESLTAVATDGLEEFAEVLRTAGLSDQAALAGQLYHAEAECVLSVLDGDSPPADVPQAYLMLHLLSHRLARPNELNLDGLFGVLPTVAWTNIGAVAVAELAEQQLRARLDGSLLRVYSIDKFPRMCDYVAPPGVRIADSARVRLGAWIGEGTTVMHEGFINFNAGAEGPNMVEGRISAGVVVGAYSDLGGGASTMGTLSGGNETLISVGSNCLIGANAGIGISLGDRCTVEAGLYLTAGSVVSVLGADGGAPQQTKARALSGADDLLFRRNSRSGAIECLPNTKPVRLNEALHAHN